MVAWLAARARRGATGGGKAGLGAQELRRATLNRRGRREVPGVHAQERRRQLAVSAMDTGVPGPLMGSSGPAIGPGDGAGLGLGRTGPRPENTRGGEGVEKRSLWCKTRLPNDGPKVETGQKWKRKLIFFFLFSGLYFS
jgi:hypothetical protein